MTGNRSHLSGSTSKISARSKSNGMELASRQSGHVTFLKSIDHETKPKKSEMVEIRGENPFSLPSDNDIFTLRDKEKVLKKQERLDNKKLKVHEKTTFTNKLKTKTSKTIRPVISDDESDAADDDDDEYDGKPRDDTRFTLSVTRDRNIEKETLTEYINKKREMFLVQYSLGVKRDEMSKLQAIIDAEETKTQKSEQYLEDDAYAFDEFVKHNDQSSVEAIRILENETKGKLELVTEIKKLNAQTMSIQSDIAKDEDIMKEYLVYKKFLETVSPKEWLHQRREVKRKRRKAILEKEQSNSDENASLPKLQREKPSRKKSTSSSKSILESETEDKKTLSAETDGSSDSEPELYFTEPQQMLDIFTELEEQNLSLILNSQETEEALEETKITIKKTKLKMEKETEALKEQIKKIEEAIQEEDEKAKQLEYKAKMFDYGEFQGDKQEEVLASLSTKVVEVYDATIGHNDGDISTVELLTNIENRLEELFEQIDHLPQELVDAAEKALDRERRAKLREEKQRLQREHQEERVRRALERAKADPMKKTGRKIVGRSEPPKRKKEIVDTDNQADREEEEYMYFFT